MRRDADEIIDALPLEVVQVLNGALMDMMLDPNTAVLIDLSSEKATLWGTDDEPFNLTTVDDTARFTSRIAVALAGLAGSRPICGAETTFNAIIDESERLSGTTLTRNAMGSADDLRRITAETTDPWSVVAEWYLLSMLTVPPSRRPKTTATRTLTRPDCTSTSSTPTAPSASPNPPTPVHEPVRV